MPRLSTLRLAGSSIALARDLHSLSGSDGQTEHYSEAPFPQLRHLYLDTKEITSHLKDAANVFVTACSRRQTYPSKENIIQVYYSHYE